MLYTRITRRMAAIFANGGHRFLLAVGLLIGLGLAGEAVLHYMPPTGLPFDLIKGVGDALLVSAILALLVDPYLKRRLRNESGWEVLFGYLNPDAPTHLREALQELASCKIYNTKLVWTVTFAWEDLERTVLTVTIQSFSSSINLSPKPLRLDERPWVLASIAGYQSEYLRYSLNCPNQFMPLDLDQTDLEPYVVVHDDGSVYVDDSRAAAGRTLPAGVHFEETKIAQMYRHASGYLPLHHGKFAENISVELRGPALEHLDIIVTNPRRVGQKEPSEWRRGARQKTANDHWHFSRATPGQLTLVSWGPAKETFRSTGQPQP